MSSLNSRGELRVIPERSFISREAKVTASQDRHPLPVPLTSFVGREQEIATICALLRRPEVRLLTLYGAGGVGKTRLSLQVATRLSKDFTDRVCFISLMDTNDPAFVLPTIARALGLQDPVSRPLMEHLQAFLKEKHLLLLLDNVEQVIDAAPALAHLLKTCSGLKILTTSRATLRVSGEYTFMVSPLALPDLARLPKKEELLQYPAITLFLERTRSVLPEFTLSEENSRMVAEICIQLDGLPLAIELAVPRLKVLSPQKLLERLAHRFQVLTQGMRDTPGRQQTIHNTLEWSYRLLNPREQQLFRFLSIFVGGCTFQALEAAWELTGYQQEPEWLLEGVASLLEKSMLSRSTQEAKEPRLLLLRTLREYGLQRLTLTGELEQFQWAHATYYLELAEEAEPALKGPQPRQWLERLQREHENLREALCFLIARGEAERIKGVEMALRLGKALERFWIIGGHVKEGGELLGQALKKSQGVSLSIRGHALCIIATLARYQGDFRTAGAAGEESLAIFRELGDPVGIAGSLYRLGYITWMHGDSGAAHTYYKESLEIAQGEQCKDARSETLYCFASMAFFQGDAHMGRLLIEESLDLSRELGDQYNIASALNILGWVTLLQGDMVVARTLQEESLAASRELGNQRGIAHTLGALGEIAYRMGDFAQARQCYEESLSIILRIDDRRVLTIYLERLASVAVAQGETIWAVLLLSAAEASRQSMGVSVTTPLEQTSREQTLTTLHDLLDEQVFANAWAQGRAMSPEQAARHRPAQRTTLSRVEKRPVMSMLSPGSLLDDLTQRERDVLRLVAQGLTDAQVAERLVISRRTVNFHLTSIYRKLEVSSRSAATRYALEHNLC
jgi:predicted ATPase/DNA-binding NarL/FixJ family response regulator